MNNFLHLVIIRMENFYISYISFLVSWYGMLELQYHRVKIIIVTAMLLIVVLIVYFVS